MKIRSVVVMAFLAGCTATPNTDLIEDRLKTLVTPKQNIEKSAFACRHEQYPSPTPEADILFKYARWLQKNNQLKRDAIVNIEIERLYRVAAEQGHAKANINLQNGAMRGQFKLRGHEYLRMSEELIAQNVATGYLFISHFLNQGSVGLKQDSEMALRFMHKAAKEGNAEAQYYIGDKLYSIDAAPEIAVQMHRCAVEQGHGKAAAMLGVYLKMNGHLREALEVLQMGVAAGYSSTPSRLEGAFLALPTDKGKYLGEKQDLERARRYNKIWEVLANYSYADPKVPEINEIVPLPPAKLPPWDGKLQWLEERLANVPPEKPSEALIYQLAKAKVLDPLTGKPKPGSPAFKQTHFPVMICQTGDPCPESGYWKAMINTWNERILYFKQGQVMPAHVSHWRKPRIWPLRDTVTEEHMSVEWGLLG